MPGDVLVLRRDSYKGRSSGRKRVKATHHIMGNTAWAGTLRGSGLICSPAISPLTLSPNSARQAEGLSSARGWLLCLQDAVRAHAISSPPALHLGPTSWRSGTYV